MVVHMVEVLILKGMAIKNVIYPYAGLRNACVDTLNSKYNEKKAESYDNVKEVKGHGHTEFILHRDLQLIVYKTSLNKKYYNSEDFIVVGFRYDYFC